MATLHFMCGKAGSGKTTLARKLAAAHAAVLLCEDEWLLALEADIKGVADYVRHSRPLRAAIGPHVVRLLSLGLSVVLDFPANTPKDRVWFRSLFESAGADHVLHYISGSDELCKRRVRQRNEMKPAGIYFGDVSDAEFDEVTRYFVPPSQNEGFHVTQYDAEASGA